MTEPLRAGDQVQLRADVFSPYDEITESMVGEIVHVTEDVVAARFEGDVLYGFHRYEVTRYP